MFSIGAAFSSYPHLIPVTPYPLIALTTICIAATLAGVSFTKTAWITLIPLSVVYLAYGAKVPLITGDHKSDYSYGLYIYAFPVQQVIMGIGHPDSAEELTLISTAIVLPLAAFSWHNIEKPSLAAKPHAVELARKFIEFFSRLKK